jgi:hypothetical protein
LSIIRSAAGAVALVVSGSVQPKTRVIRLASKIHRAEGSELRLRMRKWHKFGVRKARIVRGPCSKLKPNSRSD